jgi:hypothetical protein
MKKRTTTGKAKRPAKRRGTGKPKASGARRKKPKASKRGRATRAKKPKKPTAKPARRARAGSARRARKPRVDRTKRAVRPAAAARPLAAEEALPRALAAPGAWERLAPRVAGQLEARGWSSPDPEAVTAIAAVAAGYREGPAADPPFPTAFDADATVADAFVDFFWTGSRSPGPDRRSRLPEVRAMVDSSVVQLGLGQTPATARDTIAWIALGVWRPGLEEITRLHALPGFLVPWYRAGLA